MKAEIGPAKVEITEDDYSAIQKVSKIGIFQMISDQFGYWRQLNLIRISNKFKEKCERRGIDPKQVSPKFLAQFIEASSLDDEEDIQEIWSDILAKEAQSPGSISLRTISSLKALSKDEANAFRALFSNALKFNDDTIAIYNDRQNNKRTIADIIRLVDCGLLVSESTNITMNIPIPPKSNKAISMSIANEYTLIASNTEESEQICTIPIFSLTQAGRDILRAAFAECNKTDYSSVARKIKEKNDSLTIEMFKVEKYDKNTGQFDCSDINILEN